MSEYSPVDTVAFALAWIFIETARYYCLLLAENHLTRRLFGSLLGRVAALLSPAG